MHSHNASTALRRGEGIELGEPGSFVRQADKLETIGDLAVSSWVANDHAESLAPR